IVVVLGVIIGQGAGPWSGLLHCPAVYATVATSPAAIISSAPGWLVSLGLQQTFNTPRITDEAHEPSGIGDSTDALIDRIVYLQEFDDPSNVQPIPIDWYRIDAEGYPTWNEIGYIPRRPTPGAAVPRIYELTTQGGSTGIRMKAGAALIYAGTDHGVSVRVRTDDLHFARGRVRARLLDVNGRVIPESEVSSPPIVTNGDWMLVKLTVLGVHPEAVSIQVDLLLEQPDEWMTDDRLAQEARLRDVRGRVQFDQLMIWRSPRIDLDLNASGNLVQTPDRPEVSINILDIPRGMRRCHLRVYADDGMLVDETTLDFELGRRLPPWSPDVDAFGWYRVLLDVYEASELIGSSWVDFAWIPQSPGNAAPPFNRFGVVADDVPVEFIDADLPVIAGLGARHCSLRLWPRTIELEASESYRRELGLRVDRLMTSGIEPTLVIDSVPAQIAAEVGRSPENVLQALSDEGDHVWDFIEPYLIDLGQRVSRWQVHQSHDPAFMMAGDSAEHLKRIHQRLGKLVPEPIAIAPWQALYQIEPGLARSQTDGTGDPSARARWSPMTDRDALPSEQSNSGQEHKDDNTSMSRSPHRLLVRVPVNIRPDQIAEYVAMYQHGDVPASFVLETLPGDRYAATSVTDDLMKRTILAWEARAPELWINRPWNHIGRRTIKPAPTPILPVWHNLAAHLAGRHASSRMPVAPGVVAIIFHGPNGGTIAIWNDAPREHEIPVSLYLGEAPAFITDAMGNRTPIDLVDGEHQFTIGRRPMFIDGADIDLALFRSHLRVMPEFVEASSAMQQHDLVLYNPWKVPLSGRFRIVGPRGWRFPTRMQRLSIAPGETRRFALDFSLPLNEIAGATAIEFEMQLQARHALSRLRVSAPIEVGHKRVVLNPSYYLDPQVSGPADLVVRHEITNRSEQPVWLKTFVTARGFKYQEQPISNLGPGETAVRLFRFAGAGESLAGQRVKVGLRELDGSGQLNLILDIN
ncbi:MAG: hypothetical protein ACOC0P_04100, partial [Planctomycetota bacterium]